jgi:hypothetical protein
VSSWSATSRRQLIEGDNWESSCADFGYDLPRMDEVMLGVGEILSRHPERGTQIAGDLWGIATRPWPNAPEVVIYYSFTDEEVLLEAVGEADEPEAEDELPPS